jgi:hypothetical protein
MMQNMYIVYRGFENKPKPKYIKGSLVEKSTIKAKDRVNKLPNRYLKLNGGIAVKIAF